MKKVSDTSNSHVFARETPAWFDEAKLGIFVIWNPAAIPAFAPVPGFPAEHPDDPGEVKHSRRLPYAEMYQHPLNVPESPTARFHAEHYGDLPYDGFVEQFRDEMLPRWSPEPMADLVAQAGARYVVIYAMCEDGFLMWPSDVPNPHKGPGWQSKRDVIGEFGEAIKRRGVRYGIAYSGGMEWTFAGLPMIDANGEEASAFLQDPAYAEYTDAHWRELVERYAPDLLWNDFCYPEGGDVAGLFEAFFEQVPDGVVNNRWGREVDIMSPCEPYCDYVTPEYSIEGPSDFKWEACLGLGTSFGYNRYESEQTYMSSTKLIHMFVDVVARGGNLLITVAPTATGDIPFAQAQRVLELGWWLRCNGEAIYGTRPWHRHTGVSGEGLGVRYTNSGDAVHAIVLGTPMNAEVELDVALDDGATVSLEGDQGSPLPWTRTPAGVRVELPEQLDERPAFSVRLAPAEAVHPFDER
jgi:alpha-L-fucosidase